MCMSEENTVSVIICVYNTKIEYLKTALDSILNQTYHSIELIIIDDASEQWCSDFLTAYKQQSEENHQEKKLILLRNLRNKGLTESLNIALGKASGKYIARMDADDICLPERIEKQVAYMERHAKIDVLACGAYVYEGKTLFPRVSDVKRNKQFAGIYRKFENERMRIRLSFSNIEFTHPTVMFRKEFLEKNRLSYDATIKKAQDYDMWVKCIECGTLDSLQEVLFISRIHDGQIGTAQAGEQRHFADMIKIKCLKRLLPETSENQEKLYAVMRDTKLTGTIYDNMNLIKELVSANEKKEIYDSEIYKEELFFWWLRKALYRENRNFGKKLLHDSYMAYNIRKIFVPQLFRHIMDNLYKKSMQLKWSRKLEEKLENYEKDILKNEWSLW